MHLRGRNYYYEYSPRGIEFAIQMFVRAIELDPQYADAYAGLADCWSYTYLYSDRSDAVREQADWASTRAQEMDAQSAQAQASRGLSLSLSGRDDGADQAFARAVQLDPHLFEAHYSARATVLRWAGSRRRRPRTKRRSAPGPTITSRRCCWRRLKRTWAGTIARPRRVSRESPGGAPSPVESRMMRSALHVGQRVAALGDAPCPSTCRTRARHPAGRSHAAVQRRVCVSLMRDLRTQALRPPGGRGAKRPAAEGTGTSTTATCMGCAIRRASRHF